MPLVVLHARGDGDAGGLDRSLAEHREFLEYEFEIVVALDQIKHVGERALAEAAIVIEELDHRDVALRVAEHHLVRRTKQRRLVLGDRGAVLLGLRGLLALLQFRHDVLHHLRVRKQVILDDVTDFLALIGGKRFRQRWRRDRQRQR